MHTKEFKKGIDMFYLMSTVRGQGAMISFFIPAADRPGQMPASFLLPNSRF